MRVQVDTCIPKEDQIITAEPDVRTFTISERDEFLILACDGIWDCRTNQQAVDFVRARLAEGTKAISEISEELFDAIISPDPQKTGGIGGDNMTCMIVRFDHQ